MVCLSPATRRPWKKLILGGKVRHPLAESSGRETGKRKPAPGDLFAYYKIKLFLLPVLLGKEKQDRREDNHQVKLLHGRVHVFLFQLTIAGLRSTVFKHRPVAFACPCAGMEKPQNYSTHTHTYPEGGGAEQQSSLHGHVGYCWGGNVAGRTPRIDRQEPQTRLRAHKRVRDQGRRKQIVAESQSAWDLLQARGTLCCAP